MPKCMKCMEEYEQTDFCPYCGRKRDAASVYTDQIPEETILNRRFIIGDAVRKDRIGFLYIAWDALLEQKVYIREWFPVKTACRTQGQIQVKSEVSQDLWKRLEDAFLVHMEKLHKRQDISQLVPVYAFFRENNTVYSVMEYVKTTGAEAEKVNIFMADLEEREVLRKELMAIPELSISSSMYNNLEVNAKGADKGSALLWLADYLGIDREETMSFGDGENDIPMIQAAGIGVAMENALDTVKAAADMITLKNDEDGVAAAIRKIIFGSNEK